jgi:immune inhibitor A
MGLLTGGLIAASPAPAAPSTDNPGVTRRDTGHTPPHPLKIKAKRDAQKQAALERIIQGKAPFKKGAGNQEVPLKEEGSDRVFVVLAEFGDTRHSAYCDSTRKGSCTNPSDGTPLRYDGPRHNEIPTPDRAVDNSTLWQADYNPAHYEDMYFNRMASYFQRQSSGRYTVNGDVTEWVKVPFNQARYGRDSCGGTSCNNTWFLLRDAMSVWTQGQLDAGKTMDEIRAYLATFDLADRYDADADGNFDEPDGFIDHFQIVHAGGDQAAGDPTYGGDAIWSHRWYANLTAGGPHGLPGFNIGSGGASDGGAVTLPDHPTGVWVGDYTIQPENGGLGVFAHEYTHDLGLPDLYDTSGNTGGAENSTAFWSLMSSGANIGDGGPDGIGDNPTDLSAWELFQLGWLSAQGAQGPFYEVARVGQTSTHTLGANVPASRNGTQAVFTVLPEKKVPLQVGTPFAGSQMFWSTQGDDLNTRMTRTTGVTGGSLTAQVNYDAETDWDYAFLEASGDGGTTWAPVVTNLSDTAGDQSGFNASRTGITGSTAGAWKALTATLPAGTTAVRFRYQTDGAVAEKGFRIDEIAINGTTIGNAETATEGWTFDGFVRTTGSEIQSFFNAYVAENRQYDGYDASLRTAYNFGFAGSKPDWVESYPYQDGLLLWYWNDQYTDNNVGDHPGGGLILPIDAHPVIPHWKDGTLMRPRLAAYDSTFGLEATDALTVHNAGVAGSVASQAAVPVFDDTLKWWAASDGHVDRKTGAHPGRYQPGWYGVDTPATGTTITVESSSGGAMSIKVAPK